MATKNFTNIVPKLDMGYRRDRLLNSAVKYNRKGQHLFTLRVLAAIVDRIRLLLGL
jgi:hypothetical protein